MSRGVIALQSLKRVQVERKKSFLSQSVPIEGLCQPHESPFNNRADNRLVFLLPAVFELGEQLAIDLVHGP